MLKLAFLQAHIIVQQHFGVQDKAAPYRADVLQPSLG
jgi:hypothetical protein